MGTQIREIRALLIGAASTMLATFLVINYLDNYLHAAPMVNDAKNILKTDTAFVFETNTANFTLIDSNVYTAGQ